MDMFVAFGLVAAVPAAVVLFILAMRESDKTHARNEAAEASHLTSH